MVMKAIFFFLFGRMWQVNIPGRRKLGGGYFFSVARRFLGPNSARNPKIAFSELNFLHP